LTELKSYLIENKRAPLIDIAHHFDVTPDAVKGMLGHWIRKGKVRPADSGGSNGYRVRLFQGELNNGEKNVNI